MPGRDGQALRFDGNDYVDWVGNVNETNYGVSLWFRTAQKANAFLYVVQGSSGSDREVYVNTSGQVCARVHSNETICSPVGPDYADNQWHQVVHTLAPPGQKLYLDGQLKASGNKGSSDFNGDQRVRLGGAAGGYVGEIDNVRVLNVAPAAPSVDAPSVLLHLDEPTGTTFANVAGGNATCNATACPSAGSKGRVGLATSFDGANDYLTLPNAATAPLASANSFTFMGWVYWRGGGGETRVFDLGNGTGQYLFLSTNNLRFAIKRAGQNEETLTAGQTLPLNTWTHVAVTLNGPTNLARIYLNGLEIKQGVINTDPNQVALTTSYLGKSQFAADPYFNGALDEPAFYPIALSPFEVRLRFIYEAGLVEERQAQVVTVDTTAPATTLRSADPYRPNRDVVLDVAATDNTQVRLVELGTQKDGAPAVSWSAAPACSDAVAAFVAFCPTFVPSGEGRYAVNTRATDAVGNQTTSPTTYFYVDGTPPTLASTTLITDVLLGLRSHPTQPEAFTIALTGTVGDPILPGGYAGSGVLTNSVTIALYDADRNIVGGAAQVATVAAGNWSRAYTFEGLPQPGVYTAVVTAQDVVGNVAAFTRTVQLDSNPPLPTLDAATFNPGAIGILSTTALLQGSVEDYQVPPGAIVSLPADETGAATSFTHNYALGRPVAQASTGSGVASAAVDGSLATASQTASQMNAWWQVDLGAPQAITNVALFAPSPQSNVQVFASDRPFTSAMPSALAGQPGVWRTGLISFGTGGLTLTRAAFTAPAGVTSTQMFVRYLRVQATGVAALALSEVRALGASATCVGSTCPATGQSGVWGSAISLDGVDDYLTLPAGIANARSLSFAGWVYWRGGGGDQRIFDFGSGTTEHLLLAVLANGKLVSVMRRPSQADEWLFGPAFPLNTWTHVAFTLDGPANTARIYLNGVQVASGTINGDPNQVVQTNNWLGRSQYPADPYFNGKLDEARLYVRVLTANEIRLLAQRGVEGVQTLAVAYRPADNTSPFVSQPQLAGTTLQLSLNDSPPQTGAPTFKDLSPYNRTVTCSGTACPALGQSGLQGSAALFDGVNDFLTLPANIASAPSFSFAAWVYWRGNTDSPNIIYLGNTTGQYMYLALTANRQLLFVQKRANVVLEALTGPFVPINAWTHVALTLDGPANSARIYLNGQLATVATFNGDADQASQATVWLGKSPVTNAPYYKGKLDEVYVLTRTLTLTEVRGLYLGANPVLALNFEDGKLRDSAAWNHTLTANDQLAITLGQVGETALTFNGSTNLVRGAFYSNTNPLSNASFTVAFWAKRHSLGTYDFIFATGAINNAHQFVHITFRPSNTFACAFWGDDLDTPVYTDLNWHHWACTYDAVTRQRIIYRDGVAVASGTAAANFDTSNPTYYIGGGPNDADTGPNLTYAFQGDLDDLAVYPRTLEAAEIAALMLKAWQPTTLATAGSTRTNWTATLPTGLEGPYAIDLRATDTVGAARYIFGEWVGNLDTLAPRLSLSRQHVSGNTQYTLAATDFNLTNTVSFNGGCSLNAGGVINYSALWYLDATLIPRPHKFSRVCARTYATGAVNLALTDIAGNVAAAGLAPGLLTPDTPTDQGTLAAIILTPTQGLVLNATTPFTIEGVAEATPDVVQTVTLTVNGEAVATANPNLSAASFALAWTPPSEGMFNLAVEASDDTGATYTSAPLEVYVDVQTPTADIATGPYTGTALSNSAITFGGVLTEANPALIQLEVGESVAPGIAAPGVWFAPWQADLSALPDGVTYPVTLTVVDIAGNTFTTTTNVLVDVLAPAPVALTITADGVTPLAPGSLLTNASALTLTWPASTDGNALSHYVAGWQVALTDTASSAFALTASSAVATRQRTLPAREGSEVYAIVTTYDVVGNESTQVAGPFYVDSPLTPDFVGQRAWMDAGCAWLGTDARLGDTPQNFYLTWNSAGLRLAWTGAHWDTAGDWFVYFDARPGGSQRAYDPYPLATRENILFLPARGGAPFGGLAPFDTAERRQQLSPLAQRWLTATPAAARPFEADYVLWATSATSAQLLSWDAVNSTWVVVASDLSFGYGQTEHGTQTDLLIPFDALDITDPAHNPLALVAFASEDTALKLWATQPANNPVSSPRLVNVPNAAAKAFALTTAFTWPSLGEGICQNGTRPNADATTGAAYTDAILSVTLSPEPSGLAYRFLGSNLFSTMSQLPTFAADADWAAAQAELCAALPNALACGRATTTAQALGSESLSAKRFAEPLLPAQAKALTLRPDAPSITSDFNPYANLSDLFNTHLPPVGDGQLVTYTYHLQNTGTTTAYDVKLSALTFGPLRLPAGTAQSDSSGEFYSLLIPVGDLAPGAVLEVVIAGVIDYSFDTGNLGAGLANLDVVVSDSRGILATNPQEWAFASYRLDRAGPFTHATLREALIGAGPQTQLGMVFDASPITALEMEVQVVGGSPTTVTCPLPAADGAWACNWDATGAADGTVFSLRARATDPYDQVGEWSNAVRLTVDATVPTVNFSVETIASLSDGVLGPAETNFSGIVSDNHLIWAFEKCAWVGSLPTCAPEALQSAPPLPQTHYHYSDAPAAPLPLGAGQGCYSGHELNRIIHVPDSFTVADLAVGLRIAHPYRYDVSAWLQAPSGAWIPLLWNTGAGAQNYDVLLTQASGVRAEDDTGSHALNDPAYENLLRPVGPLSLFHGQPAQGNWLLTLCDYVPAADDGAYQQAELFFISEAVPQATSANWDWTHVVTEALDYVGPYTYTLFAVDSLALRSEPLTATFYVDNVGPAIAVTDVLTEFVLGSSATPVVTGTVTDGGTVASVLIQVTAPDGSLTHDQAQLMGNTWTYALLAQSSGHHALSAIAVDTAGNTTLLEGFATLAHRPAAIYMSGSGPNDINPGAVFTHTFVVTNTGEYPAYNLWVTDTLPLNAHYVSGGTLITNSAIVSAPVVVWGPYPELQPGAMLTVELVMTSSLVSGVIQNDAYTATADNGLNTTGLSFYTVIKRPVVFELVGSSLDPISYGAPFTHTFVVSNTGEYPAYNLWLTDTLPLNAHYVSGGTLITNSAIVSAPVVVWGPYPVLGAENSLTMELVLTSTFAGGYIENTDYFVTAEDDLGSVGLLFTTTITPAAALQVVGHGPSQVGYGIPFTHTFVVTNTGGYPAYNLWLTDTLPVNAHYVSGGTLITDSAIVSAPVVVWGPYPVLQPGAVLTVELVLTSSLLAGDIENADYQVTADADLNATGLPFTTTVANYLIFSPFTLKGEPLSSGAQTSEVRALGPDFFKQFGVDFRSLNSKGR